MPDDNAVLTPDELHTMRKVLVGWSFKRLSRTAKISIPQLCDFERKRGNLRREQLETCARILRGELSKRRRDINSVLGSVASDGREKIRDVEAVAV